MNDSTFHGPKCRAPQLIESAGRIGTEPVRLLRCPECGAVKVKRIPSITTGT